MWGGIALLLAAAYVLPALGFILPEMISMIVFLLCIPLGIVGMIKVVNFSDYRAINKELLSGLTNQMDSAAKARLVKQMNENKISADTSVTSNRSGFEYLNELFIKRHKKILWNSTKKISCVCIFLIIGALIAIYLKPEMKPKINTLVMTGLPYFTFVLYAVNRGTNFTQALFMNCDHSLLTYSFYKRPDFVLRLFQIRLREIMKINAVPALVIGGGLSLLASSNPDGLEWSLFGNEEAGYSANMGLDEEAYGAESAAAEKAAAVQEKTSLLPDYNFAGSDSAAGTSVSGLVGCALVAALAAIISLAGRTARKRSGKKQASAG